jgi:hypothetical protein
MPRLLVFCLASSSLWAGEFAILTSGARLHLDRHEIIGSTTRLYQGAGFTEIPSTLIADFEFDPPPPTLPQPTNPTLEPSIVKNPTPTEKPESSSNDPQVLIRKAALRAGLPPAFVASVARVESAFRVDAVSPKGALGIMQLMPATAAALGADPHDLHQNIDAGARLLRDLLVQYDGDVVKALAAYNAGPAAVARYGGLPPYDETRRYVNKVITTYQRSLTD